MPGFNYRMTEFQAALGLTQMRKLNRIIASRRHLAAAYDELLQGSKLQTPVVSEKSKSVFQSYVVLLNDRAAEHRDQTISRLKEQGIETTIGTLHMPMTKYFRTRYGYKEGDYPVCDKIFKRSLTLPLHERLSLQEQEKVVRCLQDVGLA
jgi:dTDP-4-amino-4,6-dideoxygalactose transaminase